VSDSLAVIRKQKTMVKAQRKREEKGNQNHLGVGGELKGETGKISRTDELEIEGEGEFELRWVIRDGKERVGEDVW
jgi:hypothetical protein